MRAGSMTTDNVAITLRVMSGTLQRLGDNETESKKATCKLAPLVTRSVTAT